MRTTDAACLASRHHHLSGVWANVREDVSRYLNKSPENQAVGDTLRSRTGALLTPQLLCLVGYRLAHYFHARGWPGLAELLARGNFYMHKVDIAASSCIGAGCLLPHPAGVSFCGRAGIGLTLYAHAVCGPMEDSLAGPLDGAPRLGHRVTIGARASVIGPVGVGDDARLLGARIVEDVPANHMVVGRAVRAIIRRQPDEPRGRTAS